jgi:hypothetical protein
VLCVAVLFSCDTPDRRRAEILDEIEGQVRLPASALPIGSYSRYYAPSGSDRVEALYIIHGQNFIRDARAYCQTRHASKFPCGPKPGELGLVGVGDRRWVASPDELPMSHGGGCGVIRFGYDLRQGTFTDLECNGEY